MSKPLHIPTAGTASARGFELDPQSIAQRAQGTEPPSLGMSMLRGIVGFTVVSVAGFAPWAIAGKWLHRHVGEAGMYVACAAVFIALTGPLLHRLILGAGSLGRFYKLFAVTFAAYSAAWIVGWMSLRGNLGSIAGLFAGTAIMGWMLTKAFDAGAQTLKVIAALFLLNTVGYFVGGWFEVALPALHGSCALGLSRATRLTLGKLMWGVCYGIGLGAGLGVAFHLCQTEARRLLAGRG